MSQIHAAGIGIPLFLDVCKVLDERTFVRVDIDLVLCVYLRAGACGLLW